MIKIETHCHTSEVSPCGHVNAIRAVKEHEKAGYDYLIITDHYSEYSFKNFKYSTWGECMDQYVDGYKKACIAASSIKVFLGIEITFNESPNDYLVYGLDEKFLYKYKRLHEMGLEAFNKLAKEKKLLVIQAHPFREYLTQAPVSLLDGIEVYNGNKRHNSHNDLALKHALKHNLIMTGGSDYHQLEDIGSSGMYLNNSIDNIQDFVKTLKNKKYKIIQN